MAEGRSVLLQLDRERHLRYDINALADLEQVLGINLAQPVGLHQIGLNALRGFLWAGLKHEDPTLTLAGAGTLLQDHLAAGRDIVDVAAKMREAMDLAGFKPKEGGAAPLGASPSGTGSATPSS